MEQDLYYHFYQDGSFSDSQLKTTISDEELARILAPGRVTLGAAPPETYTESGLEGILNYNFLEIKEGIKTAMQIPYSWGGDYDPTVRTIHGKANFEREFKLPEAADGETVDEEEVAKTFAYNSALKLIPMYYENRNSSIVIETSVLVPEEMGMQFTVKFDDTKDFSILLGFATKKLKLNRGLPGISRGFGLVIKRTGENLLIVMKKEAGDTTPWIEKSKAVMTSRGLRIAVADLKSGDFHTFRIENHKGTTTLGIDGITYGTFTYPAETYPLRKYISGDKINELVNYSGQHYTFQTLERSAGTEIGLELKNLYYYKLHLHQMISEFTPEVSATPQDRTVLTQAEYDALTTKEENQMYLIASTT